MAFCGHEWPFKASGVALRNAVRRMPRRVTPRCPPARQHFLEQLYPANFPHFPATGPRKRRPGSAARNQGKSPCPGDCWPAWLSRGILRASLDSTPQGFFQNLPRLLVCYVGLCALSLGWREEEVSSIPLAALGPTTYP